MARNERKRKRRGGSSMSEAEINFLIARLDNIKDVLTGLTYSAFEYTREGIEESTTGYWMDKYYNLAAGSIREAGNTLEDIIPKLSKYVLEHESIK